MVRLASPTPITEVEDSCARRAARAGQTWWRIK
jgi:hypothetical protein